MQHQLLCQVLPLHIFVLNVWFALNHHWASQMTFHCRSAADDQHFQRVATSRLNKNRLPVMKGGAEEHKSAFPSKKCPLHQSKTYSELHS